MKGLRKCDGSFCLLLIPGICRIIKARIISYVFRIFRGKKEHQHIFRIRLNQIGKRQYSRRGSFACILYFHILLLNQTLSGNISDLCRYRKKLSIITADSDANGPVRGNWCEHRPHFPGILISGHSVKGIKNSTAGIHRYYRQYCTRHLGRSLCTASF